MLFLACSLLVQPARALDPNRQITQFGHTAWRVQDGAFEGTPRTLAQTTDGYLWIGTTAGLVRFDGVRFVPWVPTDGGRLPTKRINSLLGASDGSLWIGTSYGLSRWHDGRLTNYPKQPGVVTAIVEAKDHSIWIQISSSDENVGPLCQVEKTGMQCHSASDGIPPSVYWPLVEDNDGNLWMGGRSGLVSWKGGSHRTFDVTALKTKSNESVTSIVASPNGSLWVGMDVGGPGLGLQKFVQGAWKPFAVPGFDGESFSIGALLLDRDHALWIGTQKNGIYRLRGGIVDHFDSADGLSSDFVYKFFEDREGNVWVATSKGIDNFRNLQIATFSKREGLDTEEVNAVLASRDGAIWAAGAGSLQVLRDGHFSSFTQDGFSGGATSLFEDGEGRLWVGIGNTLSVYENGKFRRVNRRDGTLPGMVFGITEDTEHNVWVSAKGPPFSVWNFQEQAGPVPQVSSVRKLAASPQGGIWMGLRDGNLARFRDGHTETFRFPQTPPPGVEQLMVNADGSVLGATANGIIGWKSGKQQTLTVRNGLPCDVAYASIADAREDVWFYMQCGLLRISNAEMEAWWQHPETVVHPRLFDALDGAQPGRAPFTSGAAKAPDGRLWFASGLVLQTIDPAHLLTNPVAPPVHVDGIIADHRSYVVHDGLQIPALTRDLEIDYTALSFVAPQKIHFRYKLEGRDMQWQEPGTRRQAFYSDLRPGSYRFRVIACNNDGLWNDDGATLDFQIAPAWYQTTWFLLFAVAASVLLLWALYRARMRQLAREFAATVEVRVSERTRIARDLHDTLLQSLHGLMFRFQAARNMLPRRPEEAMKALDGAILRTEQAIAESRDAIKDLRSERSSVSDVAETVAAIGTELASSKEFGAAPPVFEVTVEGERRLLARIIQDDVLRIAREVLQNAFRHADARHIEAEIRYDRQSLRLRFRDDGKGIDPQTLREGGRPGHWGLPGIRERAQQIGARLDFWSEAGAGTEVQLTIPAAVAYARAPERSRFAWTRKEDHEQ